MSVEDYVTKSQAQKLVRDIAQLKRDLKSVAAAPADLRHAAFDGAPVPIKDIEGNVTAYIGGQDAGASPIQYVGNEAAERVPSAPFVDASGELVNFQISGLDAEEELAPADWKRAEVHVSLDPNFEREPGTLAVYIEEVDGSAAHRLPGGEWYAAVIWVAESGNKSVMSERVMIDVEPRVDAQDIEDTLVAAEQIITDAVSVAQGQIDALQQKLDGLEEFDPSELISSLNQVTQDLADARQEATTLVAGLEDRVDGIKIPDVSGFITQTEVDAAASAAETAAKTHADLVAQAAEDAAISEAQTKADAAKEAAEAAAAEYAELVAQGAQDAAIAEAEAKANAAKSDAEAAAKAYSDTLASSTLADAIADAEVKANAARDAAVVAAKQYADQQDVATLATASTDAQAKADAAQAAAETKAQQLAEAEAQAAQSAAISAAAQDALEKANAARDAAIASSAEDAGAKADAAREAAEAAAAADAQAKADAAQAEAIRQAKLDATAKADAAQAAAEAAAQQYADKQDLQVKVDAAADAQGKADAAQAAAESKAQELAEAEAEAARLLAEQNAAADALTKANAARDAAIDSAAGDATTKAAAAEAAAKTHATAEAEAKAAAAQAEAIRQAKIDATTKANAALAEAEAAHTAAGDAYSHADAALNRAEAVKGEAAADATAKANAAQAAAEAEADRLAKAEAQAAQSAAEATAKADALVQANAARDAAIAAAADDADAKTQAAQAAAVTAAKADATAKADAAQAEAIRQAKADATAKANAAKADAEAAAKQHADNLPKLLGGTTAPTGTAPNGSTWFRRNAQNTVIGRWERISGKWVQQEVSGQLIDNLEAGKITALSTEFAESVVGKLWTQLAVIDRLVATSAWIGGAMIGNDAIEAKHITASETLSGKVAEFLKLSVADLVATGAQVDDAVINKLWVDGLVGLSATLARATIASQNMMPDWDLSKGQGWWPSSLTIITDDVPPGSTHALQYVPGSGSATVTSPGIAVEPETEYMFEMWIKADKPDSVFYWDMRDQNDTMIGVSDGSATAVEPLDHAVGTRPVSDFPVPTSWTRIRTKLKTASGVHTVHMRTLYFNHSRGTERDAVVTIGGIRLTRMTDGNLIVEDSIYTRHLHVTEDMVGRFAEFMHLVVNRMDVNALWGDTAWLTAIETSNIRLSSSVEDWLTLISGRGMEVISPEGQPTVQLGNFEETGLTLYREGEATASMSDDGHVSGTIVSANEELHYQGTELSEILQLEHLPRGVVAQAEGTGSQGPWYKETGVAYLQFLTIPGRLYKVTIQQRMRSDSTGVYIRLKASHTAGTGSGWPSVSLNNDEIGNALVLMSDGYSFRTVTPEFWWTYPNPELLASKPTRLLFSVESLSSGDRVNPSSFTFTVEDMGLLPETTWSYHRGGSDGGAPAEPDPVKPPATKTKRTKTYSMSWWRTWWQNGTVPGSGVGVKEAAQGRTPYFTTAGTYRSMIGFPSMTSDLSGADIDKIEVRVRVIHSHSGSGGNVRLGTHNRTSRPSSYTGYSNAESTNTHFGRGQEKWVTLPSSLYSGFRSGTYRGVTMFTSSTSSTYYVQARPDRFAIRVTYRK